jgi:hypothetical protein
MIVIFRPQAVEDVVEAAAWYEAHAPGLGEQLHVNIDRVENGAEGFSDIEHVASEGMERLGKAT